MPIDPTKQPEKPKTFWEQFVKMPAGPAREEFVYQAAIRQPRPKTVPLEVDMGGGRKRIYQVMPNYFMIEGKPAPMSPATAERVAVHFGMKLPNAKLEQNIYDAAASKGGAVSAKPLSGRTTQYGGKTYTPESVVSNVSNPELAPAFNQVIESDPKYQKNKDSLVAGHMKTILAPDPSQTDRVWMRGLYDANGKPIQGGNGLTKHTDPEHYWEYAMGGRFVSETYEDVMPNGQKKPGVEKNKGSYLSKSNKTPDSNGHKAGPPPGTIGVQQLPEDVRPQAEEMAKQLRQQPMWTETLVDLGGTKYIVKIEPHDNSPKGASFYKVVNQQPTTDSRVAVAPEKPYSPAPASPAKGRMSILQRINDLFDQINRG